MLIKVPALILLAIIVLFTLVFIGVVVAIGIFKAKQSGMKDDINEEPGITKPPRHHKFD